MKSLGKAMFLHQRGASDKSDLINEANLNMINAWINQ